MPDPVLLRPGRESDWPFVLDSWLKSNEHSPSARDMRAACVYWTKHKATARYLLAHQRLTVAHARGDDEAILGWSCTSRLAPPDNVDPIVFYVYVRGGARRCGIAKMLLADFLPHACTYTHLPAHPNAPIPEGWAYCPDRNER